MRKPVPSRSQIQREALAIGRLRLMQIARLLAIFLVLGWALLMEFGLPFQAAPLGAAGVLLGAWSRRP